MKLWFASLALLGAAVPAGAQDRFVSANDGNQLLDDGAQVVPSHPVPGSVSVIEVVDGAARIVANVAAPTSVIGPPHSIAMTPDRRFAIVTASRRVDPEDSGRIVPDSQVNVIELTGKPRIVQTVTAGEGASGVAIDPAGRRVLIANRSAGTVSLFAFADGRLRALKTLALGAANSAPAQPVFFDGGRRALVTRDGDNRISVLSIAGEDMTLASDTLAAGLRPYAIDTNGGRYAVTGNIGGGGTDIDTIGLIDLNPERPRVVDTVSVGLTPEGVAMSPDGAFVAVNVNNGSNMPRAAVGHSDLGLVQIWQIVGGKLRFVTQMPVAPWGQGLAWTGDGTVLLVQSMIGNAIATFGFDGKALTPKAVLRMPAGPAAIAGPAP